MQKKSGIFAVLLVMIAVLALVPTVSAETNYTFWTDHKFSLTTSKVIDGNPGEISNFYAGETITLPTHQAACTAVGQTYINNQEAVYTHAPISTNDGMSDHYGPVLGGTTSPSNYAVLDVTGDEIWKEPAHTKVDQNREWFLDGWAYQASFRCNESLILVPPLYVYHNSDPPIDYNYPNLTITARSSSSGMAIPRVDISVQVNPDSVLSGKTDLNGDVFFGMVGSNSENSNKIITASKVGYNTSTTSVNLTENTEIFVYLDDTPWDTSSTKAVVYLDIIDEDTSAAISGATIGIKNTTNEINPWHYNTYEDSTIAFSTDGTNDLSVGQTVEFAGYKSGSYSAGHTDPISILAPVSHASLALSKSDVVDPLDIVNGSYYWYPVTVVDSVTGNAISGSDLNYQVTDDLYFINKTSATGKFNMTGKGPMGVIPFENGDTIMIEGYADGYIRGGYALGVDSDNSGVTQFVSLVPSSYQAVSGEWTAVLLAYDDDSTAALSGVSIQLKNATSRWSKSTTSSGSATFTNLISGESYTLTASKSGYTTMTKTITGTSAAIVSIDVPLSKTSINPSITTTITPLPGETSAPASDDNISGWMRSRAIDLLNWFYLFVILGSLGVLLKMFNLI